MLEEVLYALAEKCPSDYLLSSIRCNKPLLPVFLAPAFPLVSWVKTELLLQTVCKQNKDYFYTQKNYEHVSNIVGS